MIIASGMTCIKIRIGEGTGGRYFMSTSYLLYFISRLYLLVFCFRSLEVSSQFDFWILRIVSF